MIVCIIYHEILPSQISDGARFCKRQMGRGQPGQDNPNSYIILLIEEQKIHNDKFSESAARICVKCNDGDYKRRS